MNMGDVWIVDALANGIHRSSFETKRAYEDQVVQEMLLAILGDVQVDHESNGAPFIKSHPELHISISHSENWFAIYISEKQSVGVDIEIHSQQIDKTENYFLTKAESERLQPNSDELHVCWGIKESVFKMLRGNVKSLKEDVEIISIDQDRAIAKLKNKKIELRFEQSKVFTLVYTIYFL